MKNIINNRFFNNKKKREKRDNTERDYYWRKKGKPKTIKMMKQIHCFK
jgi:hypothetical protein